MVIPFRPAQRKVADLITAMAQVPRFGDKLDLVEHRILPDRVEEAAQVFDLAGLARQRRSQVKAKAVDVHFLDPIAQ